MGFIDFSSFQSKPATSLSSYQLEDRTLPLQVKEHPRARRLTLRLAKTGGGLSVSVPRRTSASSVLKFISKHEPWLLKQFAKRPDVCEVSAGALLPINGEPHEIIYQAGRGTTHIRDMADGPKLFVFGEEKHLKRRVRDFLKRQARAELEPLSQKYASMLGKRPSAIQLKDTTSRWGSCSSNRTLSYSWRIIMAPKEIQDYLVVHEVSHLCEMNHGPRFWAHVEDLCPKYDQYRTWLKVHGAKLHAWNFD